MSRQLETIKIFDKLRPEETQALTTSIPCSRRARRKLGFRFFFLGVSPGEGGPSMMVVLMME